VKISVEHSTVYRYDSPVHPEPQTFRPRPRMTNTQRLNAFEIQITPTGSTECLDQDGNLALNAWFDAFMRSVVVTFGHKSKSLHLPRLAPGFLCQLVSVIRLLHRSLRMPALRCFVSLFIVFSGSTVSVRSQVVLRGSFQMCLVPGFFVCVGHGFSC
jgi:hypothetical protein